MKTVIESGVTPKVDELVKLARTNGLSVEVLNADENGMFAAVYLTRPEIEVKNLLDAFRLLDKVAIYWHRSSYTGRVSTKITRDAFGVRAQKITFEDARYWIKEMGGAL